MYTSPYIEEFEERIQINGNNIAKEDLSYIITKVANIVEKVENMGYGNPTEFGYRARIRNHGHSCFLCEIVIRSQFHTTYEPEA